MIVLVFVFLSSAAMAKNPVWVSSLTQQTALQKIEPDRRDEVTCLALIIYFEARSESVKGRRAVGNVVMNRIHSGHFPTTTCGVLFQKGQFSFVRSSHAAIPKTPAMWHDAIEMASSVLDQDDEDASGGAMSFCQKRLRRNGRVIGNHVFY